MRTAVLVVLGIFTAIGAVLMAMGVLSALHMLLIPGLLLLAVLYERHGYAPRAGDARGLEDTGEVFEDPVSGKRVHVRIDPQTGERQYDDEA